MYFWTELNPGFKLQTKGVLQNFCSDFHKNYRCMVDGPVINYRNLFKRCPPTCLA